MAARRPIGPCYEVWVPAADARPQVSARGRGKVMASLAGCLLLCLCLLILSLSTGGNRSPETKAGGASWGRPLWSIKQRAADHIPRSQNGLCFSLSSSLTSMSYLLRDRALTKLVPLAHNTVVGTSRVKGSRIKERPHSSCGTLVLVWTQLQQMWGVQYLA